MIDPQIFRAYDIRGIYPNQLNEQAAYKIGAALIQFLSCEAHSSSGNNVCLPPGTVAVGRDARTSSPSLFTSFTSGIMDQGGNVIDIGLVSTDTLYFALNHLKLDGAAMITASHNPSNYNGVKMIAKGPKFISGDWGIPQIKKLVLENDFKIADRHGTLSQYDIIPNYISHILDLINIKSIKKMKVIVDAGNGMGSIVIKELDKKLSLNLDCMYCNPDGTFPNHPPDPLITENIKELKQRVVDIKADFGLAFDGDGDRTIFVDERGNQIGGDMIVALFSKYYLKRQPKSTIVYNLTCSKSVPEIITENGGKPIRSRTGHAFMKETCRKNKAIFGGEISGHLYFRDIFYAECGGLTLLLMMEILSQADESLSELIKQFKKYHKIGEINFKVDNRDSAIEKLSKIYADGKQDRLDGLTVDFDNWWFNARSSNTQPLLRITVEADQEEVAKDKMRDIERIIGVI